MLEQIYKYHIVCDHHRTGGSCKNEITYETAWNGSLPDGWKSRSWLGSEGDEDSHYCPRCYRLLCEEQIVNPSKGTVKGYWESELEQLQELYR